MGLDMGFLNVMTIKLRGFWSGQQRGIVTDLTLLTLKEGGIGLVAVPAAQRMFEVAVVKSCTLERKKETAVAFLQGAGCCM